MKVVGFAVDKSLVHMINEFKIINHRIAFLIVKAKWFNIVFVNVHSLMKEKLQEEIENFYEEIKSIISGMNDSKTWIILAFE